MTFENMNIYFSEITMESFKRKDQWTSFVLNKSSAQNDEKQIT